MSIQEDVDRIVGMLDEEDIVDQTVPPVTPPLAVTDRQILDIVAELQRPQDYNGIVGIARRNSTAPWVVRLILKATRDRLRELSAAELQEIILKGL